MCTKYDFLGYKLCEINYKNYNLSNFTYIKICVDDIIFNEENKIANLIVKVYFDYDNTISYFIFQSGFKIYDSNWILTNIKSLKNEFFELVIPFIREKIYSLTSDNNNGLLIPIINIKELNLEKEIKIIRK